MMPQEDILPLLTELQLEHVHGPLHEGQARCVVVRREHEGQGRALLYLWDTQEDAARAIDAVAHEALGMHIFAIPEPVQFSKQDRWLLLEHPDGVRLNTWLEEQGTKTIADLPLSQSLSLLESLGVLLRKLHSIDAGGVVGDICAISQERGNQLPTGCFHTFNGWVASKLEQFTETLNHASNLDQDQRLSCLKYLGDLRHELSSFHPRHPAVFSHGFLKLENLWVSQSAGDIEVIAMTGFDQACFLPAEADLAKLLWIEGLATLDDTLIRAFYRGYGAAHTMDVQRRERFYRRLAAFDVLLSPRDHQVNLSSDTLIKLAGPSINPLG